MIKSQELKVSIKLTKRNTLVVSPARVFFLTFGCWFIVRQVINT